MIYRWVYGRTYSNSTYLTMIPLILGCAIATAGDYQATVAGFLMTFLGVILASVKTVATNRIMTGPLSLSALEVCTNGWGSLAMYSDKTIGSSEDVASGLDTVSVICLPHWRGQSVSHRLRRWSILGDVWHRSGRQCCDSISIECRWVSSQQNGGSIDHDCLLERQTSVDHHVWNSLVPRPSRTHQCNRHVDHDWRRSLVFQSRAGQ